MIPILMKYKCDSTGMWHHHKLTSEDVQWYNTMKQTVSASSDGIGAVQKACGKLVGWYVGIQDAIALLDRHHIGQEMAVVYIQSHPFDNCCFNDQGTRCHHIYDNDGRKITHMYNRRPLQPSKRLNEKNDSEHHGKGGKVVESTKAVKATSEPMLQAKQMISQQIELPSKDDINEDDHHDNDAVYADENDTLDDSKCHLPQHHRYANSSIVRKKKKPRRMKRK